MGLRFSLDESNLIGHLVNGNYKVFTRDMFENRQAFIYNFSTLIKLLGNFDENYYSVNSNRNNKIWEISLIKKDLLDIIKTKQLFSVSDDEQLYRFEEDKDIDQQIELDEDTANIITDRIKRLSDILSSFAIKALLIPGPSGSRENEYIASEELLYDIVRYHPDDSCLILQIKGELCDSNYIDNIDITFCHIYENPDILPAILVWSGAFSSLIPLYGDKKNIKKTLYEVFDIIHAYRPRERTIGESYSEWNRYNASIIMNLNMFKSSIMEKRFAYFLHLSDLHFGFSPNIDYDKKDQLLRQIYYITNKLKWRQGAKVYPVITGDLVDSPKGYLKPTFKDFKKLLKLEAGTEDAICVLGNHDVKPSGYLPDISSNSNIKKIRDSVIEKSKKVILIKHLRIMLIKINSTNYTKTEQAISLAKGRIGTEQLKELEDEMSKINNASEYVKLVLLHHHPVEFDISDTKAMFLKKVKASYVKNNLKLEDSQEFLDWAVKHDIKYILHGHRHIPFITDYNGIKIIAAGSSTAKDESNLKYSNFNILKYDVEKKRFVTVVIYYCKDGIAKHLEVHLI